MMVRRSASAATGSPRRSAPTRCAAPAMSSKRAASRSPGTDCSATAETSFTPGAASSESNQPAPDVASAAFGAAPALDERSVHAIDWIAFGQWHRANLRHPALVIPCPRRAHIRVLANRIGANDDQIQARSLVLVRNAGGDHDDVTGLQLHCPAMLAAEPNADRPDDDAEDFMRGAVVVMMRVDAVAPSAAPTVALEQSHASLSGLGAGLKYATVDDQRQPRIVRHAAVTNEQFFFDFQSGWCRLHCGTPSLPFSTD